MNQQQVARLVDKLAAIKAKQANLETDAQVLVTQLKKLGGGQSEDWVARLVKVPEKLVHVKAHKQLRLFARTS